MQFVRGTIACQVSGLTCATGTKPGREEEKQANQRKNALLIAVVAGDDGLAEIFKAQGVVISFLAVEL